MAAANELKIFDGISRDGDYITFGKFMCILENVLNTKFVDVQIGATGAEYTISEKETFLNKRHNIYIQDGVLTGYKYSSLYGDVDLESDKVQINRAEYNITEELPIGYIGYNVSVYVDGDSYDTIITLWLDAKKNNVYEIKKRKIMYHLMYLK